MLAPCPLRGRVGGQRIGVGTALVFEALSKADADSEPLVTVEGHPGWYPRLGSRSRVSSV
jgi:predicted N-acetyltransferase YhbS